MKVLFKLTILPVLLLLGIVNSTSAAFPLEKQTTQTVSISQSLPVASTKAEVKASKTELKKELKEFKKDKTHWYSGGKSKTLAAILAFFLGSLGVHSFYMGQTKKGFIQLGLSVLGIVLYVIGIADYVSGMGESFPTLALVGYLILIGVGIWALVDFVRILTGGLEPEEGFSS